MGAGCTSIAVPRARSVHVLFGMVPGAVRREGEIVAYGPDGGRRSKKPEHGKRQHSAEKRSQVRQAEEHILHHKGHLMVTVPSNLRTSKRETPTGVRSGDGQLPVAREPALWRKHHRGGQAGETVVVKAPQQIAHETAAARNTRRSLPIPAAERLLSAAR